MTPDHVQEAINHFHKNFETMMENRRYILEHYPDVPESEQGIPEAQRGREAA
jgi:hypothetical protein